MKIEENKFMITDVPKKTPKCYNNCKKVFQVSKDKNLKEIQFS